MPMLMSTPIDKADFTYEIPSSANKIFAATLSSLPHARYMSRTESAEKPNDVS